MTVRVSENFGIIIRKESLQKIGIGQFTLLQIMEVEHPLDEDELLFSFGPHFGGEAAGTYINKLEELGLAYGKDFIDFSDMLPSWLQLYVSMNRTINE